MGTICLTDSVRMPLGNESVHLIVTSPPYFNARDYSEWETYEDYLYTMSLIWAECYRVLVDGGRICVNVPQGYGRPSSRNGYTEYVALGADTTYAIRKAGFILRGHIVWSKKGLIDAGTGWGTWKSARNPVLVDVHENIIIAHKGSCTRGPGEDTIDKDTFMDSRESVWEIFPMAGNHWHPARFPAEIPYRLINLYSYNGDIVLDPFSGSGTTVSVADTQGRIGIGFEIMREYAMRSAALIAIGNRRFDIAVKLKRKSGKSLPIDKLPLFSERSKYV